MSSGINQFTTPMPANGARLPQPDNVGILAIDVYFPGTCVNQTALGTVTL